jgi:hypothetical protein
MDFHRLVARMQELDRPVAEVQTQECGEPMPMTPPMSPPPMSAQPPVPPPSMSVNLNAQGMDNIKDMLNLWMKVNPDMMPKAPIPMPSMSPEPNVLSIKPMGLPPLKMLPDFDADNDDMPGGEKDMNQPGDLGASLDRDSDGDHDMDDHGMEKDKPMLPEPIDRDGEEDGELDNDREKEEIGGALAGGALGAVVGGPLGALTGAAAGDSLTDPDADEVEKQEAWENEPEEQEASIDYMNNKLAGGMNKPKDTFPKVAGGDNPMQKVKEGSDLLRLQIRAELQKRLAEAKGAK